MKRVIRNITISISNAYSNTGKKYRKSRRLFKSKAIKTSLKIEKVKCVADDKICIAKSKAQVKLIETKSWFLLNKVGVIIFTVTTVVSFTFYFSGYLGAIGMFFMKVGLGINVGAAKTVGAVIAKVGMLKVTGAVVLMIVKRVLLDKTSKFFIDHGVSRFIKNLLSVLKIKFTEFKNTNIITKIYAALAGILTTLIGYFTVTQFLASMMQKFIVSFVLPFFSLVFSLIITLFAQIIGFFISGAMLLIQVLALNTILNWIQKWSFGKKLMKGIDWIIEVSLNFLNRINEIIKKVHIDTKKWFFYLARKVKWFRKIFIYLGLKIDIKFDPNPKRRLIRLSKRFDKWLLSIIDSGLNVIDKFDKKRERFVNPIEFISFKRKLRYDSRKQKKVTFFKKHKKKFLKFKIFSKKGWKDKRKEKEIKIKNRKEEFLSERIKKRRNKRFKKRVSIDLPYLIMVRNREQKNKILEKSYMK